MMKTILFLLFAGFVSATWANTPFCDDNVLDQKIKEAVKSTACSCPPQIQLVCQNVQSRGADATCPSGFKPTGCACGMRCGSWDIRGDITCHCQCGGIDWTSARCCKIS